MEKTVKLSVKDAKKLYELHPEIRDSILKDFSNKELGIYIFPKSWEELEYFNGYYVDMSSNIKCVDLVGNASRNKNVTPTELDAKSYLAECQLRQLAKSINDGQTEEEWIDWDNYSQAKYRTSYYKSKDEFNTTVDYLNNHKTIYFKRFEDLQISWVEHRNLWLQYFKVINKEKKI